MILAFSILSFLALCYIAYRFHSVSKLVYEHFKDMKTNEEAIKDHQTDQDNMIYSYMTSNSHIGSASDIYNIDDLCYIENVYNESNEKVTAITTVECPLCTHTFNSPSNTVSIVCPNCDYEMKDYE